MTRKRARKILMSIGTSRNHANWGADGKAALEDKRRCGRGHADDHPVREAAAGKNGGEERWLRYIGYRYSTFFLWGFGLDIW